MYQLKEDMIHNWYKQHITIQIKYAFCGATICGIISYVYLLVNNLNNHDNISVQKGLGSTLGLGRWSLEVVQRILSKLELNYNIPFLNCFAGILLLGMASAMLVLIFNIEDKYLCAVLGAITTVFPTIAGTMIYSFTVAWYCFAILIAIIGIYYIHKLKKLGLVVGSLCFAVSLGFYQAYYPYVCGVILILLMIQCLEDNITIKIIVLRSIKFLVALILGYLLYKYILDIILFHENIVLSSHQGVSNMGNIDIKMIPSMLCKIYQSMFTITHENYCSISIGMIMQYAFRIIYLMISINATIMVWRLARNKEYWKMVLFILILLLFPVAVNFVVVMGATNIYVLMQLGFVTIFYFLIVLTDQCRIFTDMTKLILFYITICIMTIVISNYIYQNNVNYRSLYYTNRKIENYYHTVFTQIKSTDGYTEDCQIYFIGRQKDDSSFLSPNWGESYIYEDANTLDVGSYAIESVVRYYLGYHYEEISENDKKYREYQNDIDKLNIYPNNNSIQVVDDVVLVRFE